MLNISANSLPELRRLTAILQGVQDAATVILSTPGAWPEEVALSVSSDAVNIYPQSIETDPRVGSTRLGERGVIIRGELIQRRQDAGILGERRLPSVAQALYAAMVLDTITLPQLATTVGELGPGAMFTCSRGRLNTTGGNDGTQIIFVADWTLTLVLQTATLAGDPDMP